MPMPDAHMTQASHGISKPQTIHGPALSFLLSGAVMLATIMEVLDTTIANVALDHIWGSFSAGVDEATWVLTSYEGAGTPEFMTARAPKAT